MRLKNITATIWQLPQMALGLLIKTLFKAKIYTTYKGATVFSWRFNSGVSLGNFIFVPFSAERPDEYTVQQFIKHEYGHTVQSKYLGWLYLIVIGLPSFVWAGCFDGYRRKRDKNYYDFYTERSADKLGGVDR